MIDESKPKENKGEVSASVRDQKSPSLNYWINIERRVKRRMLIGQIMQRNQDHPQGANMRIGIGKVRILMQHIISLFWAANANAVDASLCSYRSISIMGQV